MNHDPAAPEAPPRKGSHKRRIFTVPNGLCAIRLAGSFVLIGLAAAEASQAFFWLMMVLLMTDWIDGKLAIWLRQQTEFGARLDSVADAALYTALLVGCVLLKGDLVVNERWWWLTAVGSYVVTSLAGLLKFGRLPSYHTRAAKISWLLTMIAVIAIFAHGSPWPLRIAMLAVTLTNLEATLMTLLLPRWHSDVLSIWHAWRIAQGGSVEV